MKRHLPRLSRPVTLALVLVLPLTAWVLFCLLTPFNPWVQPRATIVLHPVVMVKSDLIQVTATVTPRTETQSPARLLTSTQTSPRVLVQATGIVQQPATVAHGFLTFYNPLAVVQTVAAGTVVFPVNQAGLSIVTDQSVTIPPGVPSKASSATAFAHTLQPGARANIGTLAVNGLCDGCGGTGIAVKNLQPFAGGRDALHYTVVQSADLEDVARAQQPLLEDQAQTNLRGQIRDGEQLGGPAACVRQMASNPGVGARATQVFVQISTTCTALVYDLRDVQLRAAALFRSETTRQLDPHLVLTQPMSASVQVVTEHAPDTLSIAVFVRGSWVYRMSANEQARLLRQLTGKPRKQALAELSGLSWVQYAAIPDIQGNDQLPLDPGQLTLRIISPNE